MSIYMLTEKYGQPNDTATDFLDYGTAHLGDAPRCSACGNPVGMKRWLPPLRVELDIWGQRFGDLAFGPGDDFLVSERFKDLWHEEGLNGLEGFDSVEVVRVKRHKKSKNEPPHFSIKLPGNALIVVNGSGRTANGEVCCLYLYRHFRLFAAGDER